MTLAPISDTLGRVGPARYTADTDSWTSVVRDVAKLAQEIAGTDFVPAALRDNPAAVTAAILYGREVGLPPMTALTQTYVIHGRPAMHAEGMRALVLAAGHELVVEDLTGAVCTMGARRAGSQRWTRVTWNLDMARAAGLLGDKSNWGKYPRAMLAARCTAELCRLVFPDVIHGFAAVEEMDETVPIPGEMEEAPSTSTSTKVSRKRKPPAPLAVPSETTPIPDPPTPVADTGPTSTEPPPIAPDEAPPAVEEVPEPDAQVQAGSPPEAPEVEPKLSLAQRTKLAADFTRLGVREAEERYWAMTQLVGRPIGSANELKASEARTLIDTLAYLNDRADLERILIGIIDDELADEDAEDYEPPPERLVEDVPLPGVDEEASP